jgi:C4-dicarboxylate-specific signal transduction histidine kinase
MIVEDIEYRRLIEKKALRLSALAYTRKNRSGNQDRLNLPPVFADAVQIDQVLLNLYLNAIDAMPDGNQTADRRVLL